jgi:hypothetical protein
VIITFTSDADALLARLTALRGLSLNPPAAQNDREARLTALQEVLAEHLEIRIDDRPMALTFGGVEVSPSLDASLRFRASPPRDAATLTVRTTLVYGSYALTVRRAGETTDIIEWLNGSEWSAPVSLASQSRWQSSLARTLIRDVWLGYSHILPGGLDHILFVVGLFLLDQRLRSILLQVSAFTVAHSITLGLTLYGVVSLPSSVVEPLIALSIVYVACENLVTSTLRPWRIALVFGFGLLHGMGFADALARLNLARSEFLTTLVAFNVGVEAGQLSVLALAALVVGAVALSPARRRLWVARPASVAIAGIGAIWVVERLLA